MRELLQAYMHGIADEPYLLEYLSVILHFIQVCITYYGCPYEDILKDLLIWANQIRLMPGKHSQLGQDFFHLILK